MEKENPEFEICFRYYEKAIEGRNFHYQNYNHWVNLYSIFTGAVFIAYYTIFNKLNEPSFLEIVLQFLGLITSICWLSSVRGYYHWMLSWIKVVHEYEKKLADISKDENKYFVYSVLYDIQNGFCHKNLSTQKITVIFVFCVICAWILLLVRSLYKSFVLSFLAKKIIVEMQVSKLFLFIAGIVTVIFVSMIVNKQSSNSKGMVKDIYGIQEWENT